MNNRMPKNNAVWTKTLTRILTRPNRSIMA